MARKRRRQSLPDTEFETHITALSHEGRGVAQIDGKATFLFGGLPDEDVRFRYTRQRASYDEGTVTDVIKASPHRVTPRCEHFMICGGCSLQHLTHAQQIAHKQTTFLELLKHQANLVPEHVLPPLTAEQWGYRHKARIGVKFVPKKEKVIVGFRERGGRLIADLSKCEVLHPNVGERIKATSECIYQLETRDAIPQLEIAISDDVTAVIVRHLASLPDHDREKLIAFARQASWQLYLQPKGLDSVTLCYPEDADDLLKYRLDEFDLTLQFHPTQFTQVNPAMNRLMINRAIELLDLQSNDHVLDLFCGIGNFSLPIARHCAQVVGVEGDEGSVERAAANATLNEITNTEFYTADLFTGDYNKVWSERPYNKVLLDPPRAGAEMIASQINQWPCERVVYVSCNPSTFARDAAILSKQGFRLQQAGILDMFPHTQHVEVISLFERA